MWWTYITIGVVGDDVPPKAIVIPENGRSIRHVQVSIREEDQQGWTMQEG